MMKPSSFVFTLLIFCFVEVARSERGSGSKSLESPLELVDKDDEQQERQLRRTKEPKAKKKQKKKKEDKLPKVKKLKKGSSAAPSSVPSSDPSFVPSSEPSSVPSFVPSSVPSSFPSAEPSTSMSPTCALPLCEWEDGGVDLARKNLNLSKSMGCCSSLITFVYEVPVH